MCTYRCRSTQGKRSSLIGATRRWCWGGTTTEVKVAHFRLAYSRMFLVIAYMRESQEMLFDAHRRWFEFIGGMTLRALIDNMKTAITTILRGKERDFNRRYEEMSSHYLFEAVACTPAAGWEKGQ